MDTSGIKIPIPVEPDSYLARVVQLADSQNVAWPRFRYHGAKTSTVYHSSIDGTTQRSVTDPDELIQSALLDEQRGAKTICVIENILPSAIELLGKAWDLEPAFFVEHARNPPQDAHWTPQWEDMMKNTVGPRRRRLYYNLMGTLTHHGPEDLFLTDSPCTKTVDNPADLIRLRTTLRLPYASNRGGIVVPAPMDRPEFDLMRCFTIFLMHSWHLDVLYIWLGTKPDTLPVQPFLYLLSNSAWMFNLRHLSNELKYISYVEIRNPNRKTNDRLHDLRGDLSGFRARVFETNTHLPAAVAEYYDNFLFIKNRHRQAHLSPAENHGKMLAEADKLDAFLMDTFQLLMSSLSVRDSQTSIEQARRGTLITYLAFIYVPLSFVTGIFGMNVKEVNGSPLSVWVCFAALAIVFAGTAAIFVSYRYLRKLPELWRQARESWL
ncbi:hypothetical protein LTR17_003719 [Elasticomyces elasticus]|nr:hypothetical protein LTR17_003719 [Elasticomyces elasticus]